MKKWLSVVLALVLTVSILAGCGKTDTTESTTKGTTEGTTEGTTATENTTSTAEPSKVANDRVLLTVGEYQMIKAEANIYIYTTKLNVERMGLGDTIWVNEIQEGKTFEALQLEQLKNTMKYVGIINEEARKRQLSLTEEEKTALSENVKVVWGTLPQPVKDYYGFTVEIFEKFMQAQELALKVFEDEMKDYEVDQTKLKELYEADANYQKLETLGEEHYYDQVRARHILISTLDAERNPLPEDKKAEAKKKAEEILAKAKAGEDFAALAKEYSEDPGSKDNGGEYTFGYGKMVPEFETTAFALEPGEISGLVETSYGYHIIKLEEKIASTPEKVEEAKALRKNIIKEYEQQLKAEAFQGRYEELQKNYTVEFDEEVFESLSLSYTVPLE